MNTSYFFHLDMYQYLFWEGTNLYSQKLWSSLMIQKATEAEHDDHLLSQVMYTLHINVILRSTPRCDEIGTRILPKMFFSNPNYESLHLNNWWEEIPIYFWNFWSFSKTVLVLLTQFQVNSQILWYVIAVSKYIRRFWILENCSTSNRWRTQLLSMVDNWVTIALPKCDKYSKSVALNRPVDNCREVD